MRKNLKKKSRRSFKNLIIIVFLGIFAILAIAFLISTNWKIYQKESSLKAKIIELKKETEILERENNDLNKNLSYAKSEDYLEKVAREQLDLKKPGEEVVVIQKEDVLKNTENQENKSWWEKLKGIFIK